MVEEAVETGEEEMKPIVVSSWPNKGGVSIVFPQEVRGKDGVVCLPAELVVELIRQLRAPVPGKCISVGCGGIK